MARQRRHLRPNAIYHVVNHGQAHCPIFETREDVARLLSHLGWATRERWIRILCVCVMGTHVHILALTEDGRLDYAMKRIQQGYAVYYNRTRQRTGHVFKDRYFAREIDDDIDLALTASYIDWNPVAAGMVATPTDYEHGSARQYCGADGMSWLHRDPLEAVACRIAGSGRFEPAHYRRMWAYADRAHGRALIERATQRKDADLSGLKILVRAGPEHVQRWLQDHASREVGRSAPCLVLPGEALLARLGPSASRCTREDLALVAGLLHATAGWPVQDIAGPLGRSRTTVSDLLAEHRTRIRSEPPYLASTAALVAGLAREMYGALA